MTPPSAISGQARGKPKRWPERRRQPSWILLPLIPTLSKFLSRLFVRIPSKRKFLKYRKPHLGLKCLSLETEAWEVWAWNIETVCEERCPKLASGKETRPRPERVLPHDTRDQPSAPPAGAGAPRTRPPRRHQPRRRKGRPWLAGEARAELAPAGPEALRVPTPRPTLPPSPPHTTWPLRPRRRATPSERRARSRRDVRE